MSSPSVPAKYCPRCNTLLPAEVPVCSVCGLQFGVAPVAAPPGASQPISVPWGSLSGEQFVPGSWPQGQAGWPPTSPGSMPQAQPGPVGYAPASVAAPPRQVSNNMILIGLAVVIAIIAAVFFVNSHTGSSFDRHNLQDNVPLPDNVTFKLQQTISSNGRAYNEWFWTVDSPNDPSTVERFYRDNLSSNGWTHIQTLPTEGEEPIVVGCQNSQLVAAFTGTSIPVTDDQGKTTNTITAPAGGSALEILLTTDSSTVRQFCG